MVKEELEAREKLTLRNIAIEWLGTEHSEGNIQSLVNLILSFTEPREKKIEELEQQIEKMKADVKQGQSYWNSGEMQYDLYQRLLDKWEIEK